MKNLETWYVVCVRVIRFNRHVKLPSKIRHNQHRCYYQKYELTCSINRSRRRTSRPARSATWSELLARASWRRISWYCRTATWHPGRMSDQRTGSVRCEQRRDWPRTSSLRFLQIARYIVSMYIYIYYIIYMMVSKGLANSAIIIIILMIIILKTSH